MSPIPKVMVSTKAVLFDLDDTLIDHQHSMRAALAHLRTHVARLDALSLPQIEAAYSEALHRNQALILTGKITLAAARLRRIRAIYECANLTPTDEEVAATTALYHRVYRENERLIEGAQALLSRLKNAAFRLGLITNHTTKEQNAKVARWHLDRYFDAIVIAESVQMRKPEKRIFEHTLHLLDCAPQDAVMIGDSWDADIVGARNAGVAAIWLNRYQHPIPDPTYAVEITALTPTEKIFNTIMDCLA